MDDTPALPALLAGASGLVGRAIARQWPGPAPLLRLVRRAGSGGGGPERVVDFAALPPLPAADLAFCALGTTIQVAGSQAAFRAVDFDAVLAFARAARAAGVRRFAAVSALGANPRSSNFYSRVKGEAEAALAALGFETLILARPSLLVGDRAALGQPLRRGEIIGHRLTAPLGRLLPAAWRPIEAEVVARALLRAAADGPPGLTVLSSAQLQDLGRS